MAKRIHIRAVAGRTIRVSASPADTAAPYAWEAIDDDNYDGAPDAGWQPIGTGSTEQAAVDDLIEQFEEHYA